jgi:hypothetical protein
MQHHGTSHGHDVSNGTLGDTILVVGSDACELHVLSQVVEVGSIGRRGEGAVVGLISLYSDAHFVAVGFILLALMVSCELSYTWCST